jgi:glycosyl transferase, family 25
MDFYNYVDKIVYINLESRIDRNDQLLSHLKEYNVPQNKIIRIDAVKHKVGIIGCGKSHIDALQYAIDTKLNNVMILEDDFNFTQPKDKIDEIFRDFFDLFKDKYKVFQLHWGQSAEVKQINKTQFYKANCGGYATGYIVNSSFYHQLMENLKYGNQMLISTYNDPNFSPGKNNFCEYNIDMYWTLLQKKTLLWITYLPSIGYQQYSYSDIDDHKNK